MRLPELYSANCTVVTKSVAYIFNKYNHLLKFKKNPSILEIGTGDGRTTSEILLPILPKNPKEIILSDKSAIMLEPAKTIKSSCKLQYRLLDIEGKKIPEDFRNRFDNIFSLFTFHWFKTTTVPQALENIWNMLQPDGETFCIFFTRQPSDYSWTALSKHPKWSKYDPNPFVSPFYQNSNIVEIYKEHLRKCGFEKFIVQPVNYYYEYQEKEFRDISIAVNINAQKIPTELLEEYYNDYLNYFREDDMLSFKKSKDGQNIIGLDLRLVVLYAQKNK